MRFDKVIPAIPWPSEKTQFMIDSVGWDIANFNREMNRLDGDIRALKEKKKSIQFRISNKYKYLNQLKQQLNDEILP